MRHSKASLFENEQPPPKEGVCLYLSSAQETRISLISAPECTRAGARKEQGPFGLCRFSSLAGLPVSFDRESSSACPKGGRILPPEQL